MEHWYSDHHKIEAPAMIDVQRVWVALGGNPTIQATPDQLMLAITHLPHMVGESAVGAASVELNHKIQSIQTLLNDVSMIAQRSQHPRSISVTDLVNVCIAHRHDWGLLEPDQQRALLDQAIWWATQFGFEYHWDDANGKT